MEMVRIESQEDTDKSVALRAEAVWCAAFGWAIAWGHDNTYAKQQADKAAKAFREVAATKQKTRGLRLS